MLIAAGVFGVRLENSVILSGLLATVLLSTFVGSLVRYACAPIMVAPLRHDSEEVDLLPWGNDPAGPMVLGLLEAAFFYGALTASAPAAIAGWLVLKGASKWASWQHVMKLPDHISGIKDVDYIRYRHGMSSVLLTSFLVGTLANLVAAFAGLSLQALG